MVLWDKLQVGWWGGIIWDEDGYLKATFLDKFEIGTNNGAKLHALISDNRLYKTLEIQNIIIEMDSGLV